MVRKGSGAAARLGFPTANIALDDDSVSGIYAARVTAKEGEAPYDAAAYADQRRNVLEAHLLDFNGDLGGASITIELVEKLRESARFDDERALRDAIAADVEAARAFFKRRHV